MNIPDSTVDQNMPDSINILSPRPKRMKIHEEYASAFNALPQKNIKWRSPLVNSPAIKYSPNDFPTPETVKEAEHDWAHNTSTSSLASSFSSSERVNSSTSVKSTKKKSKFQFPLSDNECRKETNDSFTERGNAFDEFVHLEQYGKPNRQKKVMTQSHAANYYNHLTNAELQRSGPREDPSTKIISSTSQSKPTLNNEDFQQSQELLSDDDFLPPKTHQLVESRTDLDPNARSEYQRKSTNNVPPFTQPITIEYQHHHATNFNIAPRSNVEYYPEIDRSNGSFVEHPHNYKQPDFEDYRHHHQSRLFNPYLDDQRYAPRVSSYFSQQQPCFSVPNPCPHHVCRGHYPKMNPYFEPYLDAIPEVNSYSGYVENRNLHHSRPYTTSINDIPDSYIDDFSQQLDEPSFFVNNSPANNFAENIPRYDAGGFNRESTSYENRGHIFCPQSRSYARSYHSFRPAPENHLPTEPTQISEESVGTIFPPSAKRKLSHDNNREATQSLNLLEQSPQRRSINFNSVEERHNFIIDSHGQTFTYSASRNPNFCDPGRADEYGSMPSDSNEGYLPNRYM